MDWDNPSLKWLIDEALAGNRDAMDELFRRYGPTIRGYSWSTLKWKGCYAPDDHGPEIENWAWLAIFRHVNQLNDYNKFDWWLKKTILRLVYDHVSGPNGCINRQNTTEQLDPAHDACIDDTESIIDASIWVDEMLTVAKEISPLFSEIVYLHFIMGYTMEDIAKRLDLPVNKVRNHYYRKLRHLQNRSNKTGPDAGGGAGGEVDGDLDDEADGDANDEADGEVDDDDDRFEQEDVDEDDDDRHVH